MLTYSKLVESNQLSQIIQAKPSILGCVAVVRVYIGDLVVANTTPGQYYNCELGLGEIENIIEFAYKAGYDRAKKEEK